MKQRDIFLYHLDNELQKLFSIKRYDKENVRSRFYLATKIGFLLCKDVVYVPASHYFESDLAFDILNSLKDFEEVGAIKFLSSSFNLDELLDKKKIQHAEITIPNSFHYQDFWVPDHTLILPGQMKKRQSSASVDIKAGWYKNLNDSNFKTQLYAFSDDNVKVSSFETALYEMPCNLGERAYISDYILPLLPIKNKYIQKANCFLNAFITKEYILSFLKECDAICLKDLPIIDDSLFLKDIEDARKISYSSVIRLLYSKKYKGQNLFEYIEKCCAKELIDFKFSTYGKQLLDEIFDTEANSTVSISHDFNAEEGKMKEKIFIVHGHDDAAKNTMARFLENLGFEAIILHEQADAGLTIIEKIEKNSDVKFAVVLYTGCDIGRDKTTKVDRPRARQNVVFEHGYLMGKLSRKNVCAFVKGDVETPGDISGVIYTPMDDSDGWKLTLAKNMKAAGLDIDTDKLLC